jgi:hypothetical protein
VDGETMPSAAKADNQKQLDAIQCLERRCDSQSHTARQAMAKAVSVSGRPATKSKSPSRLDPMKRTMAASKANAADSGRSVTSPDTDLIHARDWGSFSR